MQGNMQGNPRPSGRPWLYALLGCGVASMVFVFLIVGCTALVIIGDDGSSDPSRTGGDPADGVPSEESPDQESAEQEDSAEDGANSVGLGEAGTVAAWTVTVDGVDTSPTYDDGLSDEEAQGVFKVVSLTVTNDGSEATTFDASAVSLRDTEGREYSSQTVLGSDSLFLEQINPGNSASGHAVVDMPEDAEITQVVIEDALTFDTPLVVELG